MPLHKFEEIRANVTKSGYYFTSETSTTVFAIFTVEEAERFLKEPVTLITNQDRLDVAERLTGWYRDYAGPGQAFKGSPTIERYGDKLIVTQSRGYDV